MPRFAIVLLLLWGCLCLAQRPDLNLLGVDRRVDYNDLYQRSSEVGIPWDDRNLKLTQERLALLPADDFDDRQQVPLFYRVLLRERFPHFLTSGPCQYPRSAPEQFGFEFGKIQRSFDKNGAPLEKAGSDLDIQGERNISGDDYGAESAIAVNPVNSLQIVAGLNGTVSNQSGQFHYFSTDGGTTWALAQGGDPVPSSCCDPTLGWSPDGTFAYAATLGRFSVQSGVFFYRSEDGGASWTQTAALSTGNGEDKEYLHVDHYNSGVNPHYGNIYVSWHIANTIRIARSTDNGASFQTFVHPDGGTAIGSDITSDQNGQVFHVWPNYGTQQIVFAASSDGGQTFGARQLIDNTNASFTYSIPSFDIRLAFIYVSAVTDLTGGAFHNRMYVCWNDASLAGGSGVSLVKVARSDDSGQTWQISIPHGDSDAFDTDRFNPWMEVDNNGWVHVVYYDTRNDSTRRNADMYHSVSKDGGVTWAAAVRLTSVSSDRIGDSFQWGDYNGLAIVDGQVRPIWTDNRPNQGVRGYTLEAQVLGGEVPSFTPQLSNSDAQSFCAGLATAPVQVSALTTGGFSQPISYSFDPDLPDGFTAIFSENPVPADGETTLTLETSDFTATGDYALRLVGTSVGLNRDLTLNVTIVAGIGPVRILWRDPANFDEAFDFDANHVIDVLDLVNGVNGCVLTPPK